MSIRLSVDDAEKEELREIQTELQTTDTQLKGIETQLAYLDHRSRKVSDNKKEILSLPNEHATWLTIGKMFLNVSRNELDTYFSDELKHFDKKKNDLTALKEKLTEAKTRQDKRFNEFVEAHRYKDDESNANDNANADTTK